MGKQESNYFLGDVLEPVRREVRLEDGKVYKLLGVKWYGLGVFVREEKTGKEIKADKLYQVKTGDFIYNRLFAWKSSFAIITEEFNGCLVSNEFPVFVPKNQDVNLQFILRYVLQPHIIEQVNRLSGGMSGISRKRFKEEAFLNLEFPSLKVEEQDEIIAEIEKRQGIISLLNKENAVQEVFLKQLRQSILQEAIEGKLTAEWRKQNPVHKGDLDTDAAALLEKIKQEKQKMIAEGKIKKEKPLEPIKPEEIPFELPEGWVWCRLGEICESFTNGLYKPETFYKDNGIISIRMFNIQNGKLDLGKVRRLITTSQEFDKYKLEINDIVLNRVNSYELIGKAAIVKNDLPMVFESMNMRIRIFQKKTISPFINYYLLTNHVRRYFESTLKKAANQVSINQSDVSNLIIPLPPLTEQQLINNNLKKFYNLIDELETQVNSRKNWVEELMQAVLREAFERRVI